MFKITNSNTSNRERTREVNNLTILRARNIDKNYGDKEVLKNISFDISGGERIGLVGFNGAGKTTLANIIYGITLPDKGTIETGKESFKVGYLLQSVDYNVSDFHQDNMTSEFLEITSELGLKKVNSWENEHFSHLSGGEKLKIALANIWVSNPDILILDEPTNHLDLQGVRWLINQLKGYKGTVIIISHDRYFLDQTVSKIYELANKKLTIFDGNYTEYRIEKKKRYEEQLHQYDVQQKYKERIEGQITQLKQWAGKAHRTMREQEGFKEFHGVKAKKMDRSIKSKMKRLNMELEKNKVERPSEEKKVQFQFNAGDKRGKRMIEAKQLTKKFANRTLFQDSYFFINYGERVGIVGPNGSGKSTLIKMLLEKESISDGDIWKSSSLKMAYLSQDVADMPLNKSVIDSLGLTNREEIFHARTTLANMGMKEEKINQPIQTLSLGERTRVKLTKMLIQEHDLLILDEPTNHLDLPSREQLEETLSQFTGAMLIVSHDYYFLNKLCDTLLVIEDDKIKRIEMSLEQYETKKNMSADEGKKQLEEQLLRLDTEITAVISELSLLTPDSDRYQELDKQFLALTSKKKQLLAIE
ncbi:ribosomal protection-like ABC-F family protein [Bacillus salitolerans]|uniref:Ribosomal protection-like ABC-F family protein n=1 Tax=Bacillus salitolerans TaxID=1437434 RepID=A0ABW4LTV2_9BACI